MSSFPDLFPDHYFYEKIMFLYKRSYRHEPFFGAECCFGMQPCFCYAEVLQYKSVPSLAPPRALVLSTKPLQLLEGWNDDGGGGKLPCVDHGPLNEGGRGKK